MPMKHSDAVAANDRCKNGTKIKGKTEDRSGGREMISSHAKHADNK